MICDILLRMNRNETIDKQELLDFCYFYYVNDSLIINLCTQVKAIDVEDYE